jgi:hypothetical protein
VSTARFSASRPRKPHRFSVFGSLRRRTGAIAEALATGSATNVVTDFLTDGWNDLLGYFGVLAP